MKLFKKNNGEGIEVEVTEGEDSSQKSSGLIKVAGIAIAGLAAAGIAGYKILTSKKSDDVLDELEEDDDDFEPEDSCEAEEASEE